MIKELQDKARETIRDTLMIFMTRSDYEREVSEKVSNIVSETALATFNDLIETAKKIEESSGHFTIDDLIGIGIILKQEIKDNDQP